MLWHHSRIVVKANRYWDDRFVRDLPKAVFYSLNDFCPGMPVDLKAKCESIVRETSLRLTAVPRLAYTSAW